MQKARSHRTHPDRNREADDEPKFIIKSAPTACKHTVSGSISLRCSRFFSPFLHSTCSLSVSHKYLALPDGAGGFTQGVSNPALLRILLKCDCLCITGLSPSMVKLSRIFSFTHTL